MDAVTDPFESGPHIFLVEDNDDLRLSLQWLLEGAGYTVSCCRSAEEFLAHHQPSEGCLILDLRLPGIDGLELLGRLHAPAPRVIIITAHADQETADRARRAGAWAFLEKPFDHDLLLDKVRCALAVSNIRPA